MSPINPSQNTQPSLASYFPQIASAFSNATQTHSMDRVDETAGAVMQINYGLINIPTVGSHNEITVHYHSTGSDAQLLREILRPLQSMAMQPDNAPLASLGIEGLQKKYLESLQKDKEIKNALAMYVAPECTSITNIRERFSLEEKVRDFLASEEKKVLLLLGEAGSGKSTFNRYLARSLWEGYDKEANKSGQTPIPLFISLSSLKEPNTNLISEYLKKEGFTKDQIADLKANYRFIFILDGYDEIKDRTRLFYIENELDEWQAKVIVSSRPEYLGDRYERQFHPKGQAYLLQTYQLAQFSDLTIGKYVNKYKKTHPKLEKSVTKHREILERSEVKELIRNPFLLKLALSELPTLAERYKNSSQRITRLALYDQFVESWFERSQDRLSGIRLTDAEQKAFHFLNKAFIKHGTKFGNDLAIEMYQAGLVRVTYSELLSYDEFNTETLDWRDKFFSDSNEKIKLLRFNAPLICRDDQYEFVHKSIQDYFVARALWEELRGGAKSADVEHTKKLGAIRNVRPLWEGLGDGFEIEPSVRFNAVNVVEDPAVQSFLVERVQEDRVFLKALLSWVKASKTRGDVKRGASNALTVLVKAGVQFIGCDLRGIQVPGSDLSNGVFDSSQLQGSDLSNANLRASWLRQVNLSGAELAGVQFGEWAYLQEKSGVNSCAYSPDGKNCAVGLDNGKISVYMASSWEKTYTLRGHTGRVNSVVYSPSGSQLASGSDDSTVRVWDAKSGAALHTLEGHTSSVNSVVYSPNGTQLASGSSDNTVRVWEAESEASVHTLEGHTWAIWSVAYSPSGNQIASGSSDSTVRVWEAEGGALVHTIEGHTDRVFSVVYSPNGMRLASGSFDKTVRVWEAESGASVHTLKGHTQSVTSVVYSPNGTQLASGSYDKTVRVWEAESGASVRTLEGHTWAVNSVVYSPSETQLASGSWDKTVRVWEAESGAAVHTLEGHADSVRSVAYSPNGSQIASGSHDNTVRVWEAESGASVHTLEGHTNRVSSVVYSPNGAQLASGSDDSTVRVWDAESGASVHTLEGHTWVVTSVVYSPNGRQLASGSFDSTVRVWDAESGASVHTLEGHITYVSSVAYSPNGRQLASGSLDGMVRVWDAESGASVHTLEGHASSVNSVVYSPSGSQLASGRYDSTVRVWESESGASVHTLEGHTSSVNSVVYSPSGSQLASGSDDSTVRLWDVASGDCLRVIQELTEPVISIAWKATREGSNLLTGSGEFVHQWELIGEADGVHAHLSWMSPVNKLMVKEALLEGVVGLSEMNQKLLTQRGATLPFEGFKQSS
ncbi:MAG: WD40 repeat [Glomeribacter sp. 1016415]|nr:WD40 repeat [Glomeribacter sp. 1016415]